MSIKYLIITVFLFSFSQAYSASEYAGRVVFSSGLNVVTNKAGKSKIVRRGDFVKSGDKLKTSTGRMQVRFTDQGFVSIKPRSELVVQKYKFSGKQDGSENAIFSLLKGSIRAVSGFIGRKNKKAYQYRTPVATIGIRGTAFSLNYCQADCFDSSGSTVSDGLYVNNGEGQVIVNSQAGSISLVRGQYGYVASAQDAPIEIRESPDFSEIVAVDTNEVNEDDIVRGAGDLSEEGIEAYALGLNDGVQAVDPVDPVDPPVEPITYGALSVNRYRANSGLVNDNDSRFEPILYRYEDKELVRPNDITDLSGTSEITFENVAGIDRVTDFTQSYTFTDSIDPFTLEENFSTTDQATGQFGANATGDIVWGTWQTAWDYSFVTTDSTTGLEGDGTLRSNASTDYVYQYIYADSDLLTSFDGTAYLDNAGTALSTVVEYGSLTNNVLGGQVAYIDPNVTTGVEGEIAVFGEQQVALEVDFANGSVTEFEASGSFGNAALQPALETYRLTLRDTGEVQSIFESIDLDAVCTGTVCNGQNFMVEDASATVDFLGDQAQGGAFGSYGFIIDANPGGLNAEEHLVTATYLLGQSTNPVGFTPPRELLVAASGNLTAGGIGTYGTRIQNYNTFTTIDTVSGNNDIDFISSAPTDANTSLLFNPFQTADGNTGSNIDNFLYDENLRVGWGYWGGPSFSTSYVLDETSAGGVTSAVFVNTAAQQHGDIHFLYADNITPDATLLALSTPNVIYDQVIGGNLTYLSTDQLNPGVVNTLTTPLDGTSNIQVGVNFQTNQISTFDLTATIATTDDFNLSLGAPVATTSPNFSAAATFDGTDVGAANVNFEFLGSGAEGFGGIIETGTFIDPVGASPSVITGTFVLGATTPPVVATAPPLAP